MLFTNRILHIYNIISKNNPTIYNKNKNKFIALQMNSGAWKYFIELKKKMITEMTYHRYKL